MRGTAFVGISGDVDAARADAALDRAALALASRGHATTRTALGGRLRARVVGITDAMQDPIVAAGPGNGGASASIAWTEDGELDLLADGFGRRSLFVAETGRALAFATDARALGELLTAIGRPPSVDPRALRRFYAFSCVPAPRSPWREIVAIPAGHRASWAGRLGPFERVREQADERAPPADEAAGASLRAEVEAACSRAIETESRAAVLLSGGLDSGLVAHGLSRASPGAAAFTIDLDEGSEVAEARAVAGALGLAHEIVKVDGATTLAALNDAVRALDVPIGDPVIVPFLLAARAARSLGARSLWNGEGGDQLFAGWQTKPMLAWARYAEPGEDPSDAYLATFHKLADVEREALGEALLQDEDPPLVDDLRPLFSADRARTRGSFLHLLCEANLFSKGACNVAPRIDRTCAAAGVESTSPLLDPAVVAASFRLHPTQKQRGLVEKWAVREALAGVVPPAVLALPKRGMRVPLTTWLKGPLHELAFDVLSSRAFRERGHIRPSFADALLSGDVHAPDLRRRRRDEWLWLVLAGELWMRSLGDAS